MLLCSIETGWDLSGFSNFSFSIYSAPRRHDYVHMPFWQSRDLPWCYPMARLVGPAYASDQSNRPLCVAPGTRVSSHR